MGLIYYFLQIYEVVLIIRIVMSWIRPDPLHPVVQLVEKVTDPVLEPIRKMLPLSAAGFDFSPIVVIIIIHALKRLVM
jgi:YggT family protein